MLFPNNAIVIENLANKNIVIIFIYPLIMVLGLFIILFFQTHARYQLILVPSYPQIDYGDLNLLPSSMP